MRFFWKHEVDDLRTWTDVEQHLRVPWRLVRDRRTGLSLSTHVDELLVDEPPSGTAVQRRALHQAGFRRREPGCWSWTPPEPADLPPPPAAFPPRMAAAWARAEHDRALDCSRTAQALLVLRDVYRATPADLVVTVLDDDDEDDEWDEDDDDRDVAWPALDCAALEALFGPGRGTMP